jgi:PAS domain S-box-containing protein
MDLVEIREILTDEDLCAAVMALAGADGCPVGIYDLHNDLLMGQPAREPSCRHAVKLADRVIGWVAGGANAAPAADLLGRLAARELRHRSDQASIRQTKDYLEKVMDNSPDAIGIVDEKGRVLLWNKMAERIYGYSIEELVGKNVFELYADLEQLNGILCRLRSDGRVEQFQADMRRKDGSIVPFEISISLLKDDQGKVIGSACVARDMSNLKQTLADLNRANELMQRELAERLRAENQLKQTTDYLENVLDNSPDAIGIVDAKGKVLKWSKMAEQIYGYSFQELAGKPVFDLYANPRQLSEMLELLRSNGRVERFQVDMKHRNGSVNPFETSISLLKDGMGKVIGSVCVARDMSEIQKAWAAIREKNDRIMESIDYARRLQRAILPPLPHRLGVSAEKCFVIWKPKDVVGGDLYWCRGDDRYTLLAVADCTGHGVPGALMTMALGSILDGLPRVLYGQKPSELLYSIHKRLKETLSQEHKDSYANDGADVALCMLDKKEKKIMFSGAKLSMFLENGGRITEYQGTRHSVGYARHKEVVFEDCSIDWSDGSSIYITTDGLMDQNSQERKGGIGRAGFVEILRNIAGKPFAEQETAVEEFIEKRLQHVAQRDDITVLGFELGNTLKGL